MNIGIIGSGGVGQTLGAKFAELGHSVKIGTRSPEKLADWASKSGANASIGSFEEAAVFGEVIVLATHWAGGATKNAIRLAEPKHFAGKVVIDVVNPLDFSTGAPRIAADVAPSASAMIQSWLPEAKVVKAFNIVTAASMVNPALSSKGGDPDMFIAGDDAAAKQQVTEILHSFGWKGVVDVGGIEAAAYLENLAMIWVALWGKLQVSAHAFKLVGV